MVVPATIIIPIFLAVKRYQHLRPSLKLLCWYLFSAGLTNVITAIYAFRKANNMPIMHLYTVIEFSFLVGFFRRTFVGEELKKRVTFLVPLFALFALVNVLFVQGIFAYNTYAKSLEAVLIIFLSIVFFKQRLDNVGAETQKMSPVTYVVSGLVLYFSGSLVFFVIQNISVADHSFGRFIWGIHGTLLMVLYFVIAFALWVEKK